MDGWNTSVSFWDALFSGAMLVLGSVKVFFVTSFGATKKSPAVNHSEAWWWPVMHTACKFGNDHDPLRQFSSGWSERIVEGNPLTHPSVHIPSVLHVEIVCGHRIGHRVPVASPDSGRWVSQFNISAEVAIICPGWLLGFNGARWCIRCIEFT